MSGRIDPVELKRRLPMITLLATEGVECRRDGAKHKARCPFHEERSGSFVIYSYPDASQDHAHCFGCRWNGDIIKYWQEKRGVGFVDALHALASLASYSPSLLSSRKEAAAQVPRVSAVARSNREKPALPRLRALTEAEAIGLAKLRGLSVEGVVAAALDKRVGACAWPQYERCAVHGWECRRDRKDCRGDGHWHTPKDSPLCWVVTDSQRWCAQPRQMDGQQFVRRDGTKFKSWTIGSPTWPLGASEIGDRAGVLLCEGGPDMLAGYHFLAQFNRLRDVAVVGILGASCLICPEALPFFERKRVRIMMHADAPKDGEEAEGSKRKKRVLPGTEAAARWSAQLTEAGAAVETFCLGDQYVREDLRRWRNYEISATEIRVDQAGFRKRDGSKVGDLNDLAFVDEAAWLDEELKAAFFDFDF